MRTGWTDLSTHWDLFWAQPRPSPCAFLPASQISVHRRDKSKKKKGKPLCFFFCMWNYFPPLPTQTLHGARACNSAGCFDSSQSESSVICSSESVQAKQREQCSNWQTCPDNTKARHRRVAGKIAWSSTSSEPQISLWKHFFFPLTWSSLS